MVRLSVNVNKVATLRNSRGGDVPSVVDAVRVCLEAGATGITVHPRADQRHIRRADVREIAARLAPRRAEIEFNIEGDPRPDLLALVREVLPHQCTLVPVHPGEITSQAGWPADTPEDDLRREVADLQGRGVRVSLFVEADEAAVRWAASIGAARIELYTEPYAHAFREGPEAAARSFRRRRRGARARARPRHQRRPRSRSGQPDALPHAAAPGRSVDRPRADVARALCRPRSRGTRLPGRVPGLTALRRTRRRLSPQA